MRERLIRLSSRNVGKGFVIVGFVFFIIAVAVFTPDRQWFSYLGPVGGVFFFVLGWVFGTEQLSDRHFNGKVGVLLIPVSIIFLTVAVLSSMYSETGEYIHHTSNARSRMTGIAPPAGSWDRWADRIEVTTTALVVHPYSQFSSSLAAIGIVLLLFGSALRLRYDSYIEEKEKKHVRKRRKYLAIGLALGLSGIGLLSFGLVCHVYANSYAQFMCGEMEVPQAHGYAHGNPDGIAPFIGPFPLYIDFLFTPWLDCHLEVSISTDQNLQPRREVTYTVFTANVSEPITNITSDDIRYSLNLRSNVLYTLRIASPYINESVPIIMSTRIEDSMSGKIIPIGVVSSVAGSLVAIASTSRGLKVGNKAEKQQKDQKSLDN